MKKLLVEILFYGVSSAVILPAPTWLWAWMTSKTLSDVLYR
jgi:hypothetical protein